MDQATKNKLANIAQELKSIINELDDISEGLGKDFIGIGGERYAAVIANLAGEYRYVKGKIENIE